jgi:hypothetical protein
MDPAGVGDHAGTHAAGGGDATAPTVRHLVTGTRSGNHFAFASITSHAAARIREVVHLCLHGFTIRRVSLMCMVVTKRHDH